MKHSLNKIIALIGNALILLSECIYEIFRVILNLINFITGYVKILCYVYLD